MTKAVQLLISAIGFFVAALILAVVKIAAKKTFTLDGRAGLIFFLFLAGLILLILAVGTASV